MARKKINNLIVISDLHCGCRMGLCPLDPVSLDDGGSYHLSDMQRILWRWWCEFWVRWVPRATRGEPYAIVVNGDSIDGVHHDSTTQISHNLADQSEIAYQILKPKIDLVDGRFFMIRGTEAHVGKSGVEEERLARRLGAIPNQEGQCARHELWIEVGGALCHILHHIGLTGSLAAETTAPRKELDTAFADAGQWGERAPNFVIRSHRHRYSCVEVGMKGGYGYSIVTDGWQLKTPFAYRVSGARQLRPQMGGLLIRQGDEEWHHRHKYWKLARPKVEKVWTKTK